MGIGSIGQPDMAALMKLFAPIEVQPHILEEAVNQQDMMRIKVMLNDPISQVVEDAVDKENEMAKKLLGLNLKMRVTGLGRFIDESA